MLAVWRAKEGLGDEPMNFPKSRFPILREVNEQITIVAPSYAHNMPKFASFALSTIATWRISSDATKVRNTVGGFIARARPPLFQIGDHLCRLFLHREESFLGVTRAAVTHSAPAFILSCH